MGQATREVLHRPFEPAGVRGKLGPGTYVSYQRGALRVYRFCAAKVTKTLSKSLPHGEEFEAIVRPLALGIDRHPQTGRMRSFACRGAGSPLKKKRCGRGRLHKLSS